MAETAPAAARKVVTAVFGDLVGSTALQETLDPESAQRVMARFYAVMRAVISRHGGHLDKFVGDGVVAVFGVPTVAEDDALRAVRCAADMIAELGGLGDELERGWGVRLRMRTGVNTGELVISGDGELVGDAMNTAARLEQAAAAGAVLIGEDTWRLVRHGVQLEPVEPLVLKGKAEPVRAWRLLAATPAPEPGGRAEAPLVGRTDELGRLRAALDEAGRSRSCRLVTVIGSPGMGKTRLTEEFALAVGTDATVVQGRCEPSGEGITFGPVAELLRGAAGIADSDPPDTVRSKLATLVEGEQDAERIVARAGSLLGVAEPASVQETFWGVRRVLEALARRHPLVVVLEDVHWGQPLFLDLVAHLAEWVRDAPMLLLILTRPELRETREALTTPGRGVFDVIELEPLEPGDSQAFVTGLLGRVDLPPALLGRILATTEGNPLFLGETLRMLVDDGSLTRQGETWMTTGTGTITVPPTIHALLSARIERLTHEERAVVERAAVIGKQFYRGAVAELVGSPQRSSLDTNLETLRRKEMVEPDGTYWVDEPVYRFHHVLLRDAAYRSLLKEARAELHERFADWLAAKAGDLVGEHEEVIAYHLEQAHEYRRQLGALDDHARDLGTRAAAILASAGRRALARADLAAAANLLDRACQRLDAEDPDLLWDLAEALLSAGDAVAARGVVDRLAGQGRQARADVLAGQLAILTGGAAPQAIVEQLTAAAEELAAIGDGPGAAKAHHVAAQGLVQIGRLGAAEAALDKALVAARRAGDRRRTTAVLAAAPRAALWGPSPVVRSSGRCLDVLRILRMTPGNRHVEAIALRCQAVLEAVRGRFDPARDILTSARVTLQELGLSWELHELAIHAGMIELLAGDPAAAEAHLRAARDGFTALGVDVGAAQAAALLARALVDQGRDDAALDETGFAEQHAGGDLKTTITWCGARAEALARRGSHDDALALARHAVALAEPTDALPDKADAAMALARVLRTIGQADDARAAARQARELYQSKDHAVGLARATELIGAPVVAPRAAAPRERTGVLGDRPPEWAVAEWFRCLDRRDVDGLAGMFADDIVRVDHRKLGWDDIRGRDGVGEHYRSGMDMWPEVHCDPDEVLACDDRVIAFTWTMRATDDAGAVCEIPLGVVAAAEGGLFSWWDQYDPDDRQAMIARYAELGGGQGPLGDRPSEQVVREVIRRFAKQDIDGALDLIADDNILVDHRNLGWTETDKTGHRRIFESMFAASSDVRNEIDEVLACDDRVIASIQAFRGHSADGGGVFEIPNGMVVVVEDGLVRHIDRYEPEDRQAMLARYHELGGRREVLGDRPPERLLAEVMRLLTARDVDGLLALYTEDHVRVDHRVLGWEEIRRDTERPMWESLFAMSSDLSCEVDEILACDDRVIAFSYTLHGTDRENGGPFEIAMGNVLVVENGLGVRTEFFDHNDRQAMIARYAELGGGLAVLGDRPSERMVREGFVRFAKSDLDGVFALYADDHLMADHRNLGWSESDQDAWDILRSMLATTMDARFEVDDVLACDDRIVAFSGAFRGTHIDGGGTFEIAYGVVTVVENGLIRRTERYEYDDRQAMLGRYAELGGRRDVLGDRPPERLLAEFMRLMAARDVDGVLALYTEDHVRVDHRVLGWEEIRRDTERPLWESLFAMSSDLSGEIDEVLACDDRVIAWTFTLRGTDIDGGGAFEIAMGDVFVVENGLGVWTELFDHDDRQAMIARYAELGGGQGPLGDRAPEQYMAEFARRYAQRDIDRLCELYTDDYVMVDHRTLGWEGLRKEDGSVRTLFESLFAAGSDFRVEIDEVLACDDRVFAMLLTFYGTSTDGGGRWEIAYGAVGIVENGRNSYVEQFEYDDREAMLARYAELGGRRDVFGDRPPERAVARLCRRWAPGDLDALVDLFADDAVRVDHRTLGYDEVHGRDGIREMYSSMFDISSEVHIEPAEVLACDDRILVLRATLRGTAAEGGGEFATPCGYLFVVTDGFIQRLEQFEPDQRQPMIARYVELGGGLGPLGDRPPERAITELARRLAARDVDAFVDLCADNVVLVDHRRLGWSETDKRSYRVVVESMLAASLDVRVEVDEVLACNDRVIVILSAFRGHTIDGGGAFEIANGLVVEFEGGLICRSERYEHDDHQAMLARFAELTSGRRDVLGDRPPERFFAELLPRIAARDVDGLLDLLADDYVMVDHRVLGWEEAGKEKSRPRIEALFAASSDLRGEINEVLACDDRVIALSYALRGTSTDGGGAFEIAFGLVQVYENGLLRSADRYEPDDRHAMIARYAELGGGLRPLGDRPPERFWAEFARVYATRDVDAFLDLLADDLVFTDHQKLGWPERDRDGLRGAVESMFSATLDVRFEVDEVLACDDRVFAYSGAFRGHSVDGGGPFEIANHCVYVVENGRLHSIDAYAPDDRQGALARFAELTDTRPPVRILAELFRRAAARDVDGFIDLIPDDYVDVEHRRLGWDETGKADARARLEAYLDSSTHFRFDIDEVLACDEQVIALSLAIRGTGTDGGGSYEVAYSGVAVVEDGLMRRFERFELDDRQAVIARYAELGGGLSALGEHPSEQALAEMCRRWARRDLDALFELSADDFAMVDHRALGWVETDKARHRAIVESMMSSSPDVRLDIDEVLACDDRVAAFRFALRGTSTDGGDPFEIAGGIVCEFVDGLLHRLERYEPDDREAMLARCAELGG